MGCDCLAPPKTIRTLMQPMDRTQMKKAGVDTFCHTFDSEFMQNLDLVVAFASTGRADSSAPVDYRAGRLPHPSRSYEWREIDGRPLQPGSILSRAGGKCPYRKSSMF
jgi:hypothetical protein